MEHYGAVYSLLKTAIWGETRCPLVIQKNTDWTAVSRELSAHGVDALIADVLPGIPELDIRTRQELMFKASRSMSFWHRAMKEQQALYALLREADIPFVVLKGSAAAVYYPQPECRTMGDIDIIVSPADFERARVLMEQTGYALDHDMGTREVVSRKNGVTFELHRYYTVMDRVERGQILDDQIFSELQTPRMCTMGEYEFPMLSAITNGLVLLVHVNQHMVMGLGLRQIIDWMLYVDRELDDGKWYGQFLPWVKKLGLEQLAVTVTRMCQMYLGLREEGITWCAAADETLCEKLMNVTMERGNFGFKHRGKTRTIKAARSITSIPAFFRLLHERGCRNWALAKKYPVLKPFAWIYQALRYVKTLIRSKRSIGKMSDDIKQYKEESVLWDQLEISRRHR